MWFVNFARTPRRGQAQQLNPFPGKKSIVVVGNCSIHHGSQVKELIEGECFWGLPAFERNCCSAGIPDARFEDNICGPKQWTGS